MPTTITAAAAAAPKAPPSRTAKPKKEIPAAVTTDDRAEALANIGILPITALMATGNLADARTIEIHWPGVSAEVAKLAEKQDEIARFIDPLMKVGPYTGLLAVILPMAMQFAVNHGKGSVGAMGAVSPDLLVAQMELRQAKTEAEALRLQADAEREARETRAEIEKARQSPAVKAA